MGMINDSGDREGGERLTVSVCVELLLARVSTQPKLMGSLEVSLKEACMKCE